MKTPDEESVLLIGLREGDKRSFSKLYKLCSNRLYNRLLRLTQSEELADELLQDCFVILWEKRHLVDPSLPLMNWLYVVGRHEVSHLYKKMSRDKKIQESVTQSFVEDYNHVEEAVFYKEATEILEEAIAQLPPQRGKIYRLCRMEGRSYEEASKLLGISTSTISNQLVQANKFVKNYLLNKRGLAELLLVAFLLHSK